MDEVSSLLEPEIPGLRRYARALLRDPVGADDLVQDCLERALSRWHLRRRDGDLRAWLFAILRNLFHDGLRRTRREPARATLDAADMVADGGADGETQSAVRDVLSRLHALPTDQREVILLVAVEDLSYEEVARVLSVPIGTVMSRLSRGRERLRRALEAEPGTRGSGTRNADIRSPDVRGADDRVSSPRTVPARPKPHLRSIT